MAAPTLTGGTGATLAAAGSGSLPATADGVRWCAALRGAGGSTPVQIEHVSLFSTVGQNQAQARTERQRPLARHQLQAQVGPYMALRTRIVRIGSRYQD